MTAKPTKLIWHHCVHDSSAPIKAVLKCPKVTHVLLSGQSFEDDARLDVFWTPIAKAVMESGRTAILCRWLWPAEEKNLARVALADVFDWRFYARTLYRLRAEADSIGCECALDLEPYGDEGDPMLDLRDDPNGLGPRYNYLREACTRAARTIGAADYVLPAHLPVPRHSHVKKHLYRGCQPLGAKSIAEHTFYDYPGITGVADEKFDIFGAYLVNDPSNRPEPQSHAYTPATLAKRALQLNRDMLIYPGGDDDELAAAQAFLKAQ